MADAYQNRTKSIALRKEILENENEEIIKASTNDFGAM